MFDLVAVEEFGPLLERGEGLDSKGEVIESGAGRIEGIVGAGLELGQSDQQAGSREAEHGGRSVLAGFVEHDVGPEDLSVPGQRSFKISYRKRHMARPGGMHTEP